MSLTALENLRHSKKTICLTLFLFLVSALFPTASLLADNQPLPELGSASGSFMTPAQEKRLGQAFMRSIKASQKMLDEPFAQEYIQNLGKTLAHATENNSSQNFNFFILDNPQINAFAGPGGHIGIYTGLIQTTQSESELAAVVAHEIAHVTQKHLMRTFHEASQMGPASAAVLLAAVILGATVGGDAAVATAVGGQAAMMQKQINFTRANEKEADRVGINAMAESDFETHAMPVFFERMGRANRAYASELPEFLRTHPVTTNRIADSLSRADQHPYKQRQDDLHYHLVKALIKQASFVNAKDAEKYFQTNLEEGRYRNVQAQKFGLVLALMRQQKFDSANHHLDMLLKEKPAEPVFLIQKSRLQTKTGKLKQAIKNLESSLQLFPESYSLSMQAAELYIQDGSYQKAINLLQKITVLRPYDEQVYKRMAEAAGKNNDKVTAHAYQADYLYLNGQLEPAIQQLEIALQDKTSDFYLTSRLEAKLNALRQEFDILKKEKNKTGK